MLKRTSLAVVASIAFLSLGARAPVQAQQSTMSFFVTSAGVGKGADLGGLEALTGIASR